MQNRITLLPLFFALTWPTGLFAQESDCCDREAVLYCEYNHAFTSNTERDKTEKEFSAAAFLKLKEILDKKCFRVILPLPLDASNMPQNEYQIEVKHTQVTNLTKWPNTHIIATLYFEAEGYRELVHYWEVEEPGDSLTADQISWPSFLNKLANKIKSGPEITEIVEKFEKRPVNLDVGCDKEEFEPGEVVEIFLTGFKDKRGQTSREFNRVVVRVSVGDITNGAECELGEDYKVFRVENNFVKINYTAPGDCENISVKFTIYNSCDVLSENVLFLNATQTKDKLEEKEFNLNCYDAKLTLTGDYKKIIKTSFEDKTNGISDNYILNEIKQSSALLFLELIDSQDMPFLNQTVQYYKPTSVSITGFTYSYESNRQKSQPSSETNINIIRSASNQDLDGKEQVSQFPVLLFIDNETGDAVKMVPVPYRLSFDVLETENVSGVKFSSKGPTPFSYSDTKNKKASFDLGPVGEKIQDPTVKRSDNPIQDYLKRQGIEIPVGVPIPELSNQDAIGDINPDILVKSKDDKFNLSGEGRRKIETKLEHGFEEVNQSFKWQMSILKKK